MPSAAKIEDILQSHHATQDMAVFRQPGERLSEIAAAVIQLKPACLEIKEGKALYDFRDLI